MKKPQPPKCKVQQNSTFLVLIPHSVIKAKIILRKNFAQ
jgi:hypothetical protein